MRDLSDKELLYVGGGNPEPPPVKGNNGWGNGAEGTNNGSDEGGTAPSKTAERGPHNNHTER